MTRRPSVSASSRTSLLLLSLLLIGGCGEVKPVVEAPAGEPRAVLPGESGARGWPTYGGQPGGSQYSAIDQINRDNVGKLRLAWEFHTGDAREKSADSHATTTEVTPILANDKLYLCTPLSTVIALAPDSGRQVWRFDYHKSPKDTVNAVFNCRGVAYWQEAAPEGQAAARTGPEPTAALCRKRVIQATDTGMLMALDADTGKPCADFGKGGMVDLNGFDNHGHGRISMTSPPAIVGDVIVVGSSVKDNAYLDAPDGIVRGIDVRTGEERWNWNPIPAALSAQTGGANTWAPISVDTRRGWVFLPTGSASLDLYGVKRMDPQPDANSVVVLDGKTGRKVWSFRTVHHAIWDYDLAAMPTLVTLMRGGKPTEAVLQPTKTGLMFVLDRQTGRPLFPVEERPVPKSDIPGEITSPTQPVPVLPEPLIGQRLTADRAWGALYFDRAACRAMIRNLRNEGMFTPPSTGGSLIYPGYLSGTNWGGVAFDQRTGIAVMNSVDIPFVEALVPKDKFDKAVHAPKGTVVYDLHGAPYMMTRRPLLSPLGAPCNPPPWGRLTALDLNTGKIRWQIPFGRQPLPGGLFSPEKWGAYTVGGPIITGGGLIFIGATLDSQFRAVDLATGKKLWSTGLPVPATATPMTYEYGPKKKQFVVIAAGGHASLKTAKGDGIYAFALP